jgi:hypothetical protein
MTRPTLGDERVNWRHFAVGVCVGAALAAAPFVVIALMAGARLWIGG